jgi:magnesium chelatase subunit D
MTPNQPADYAAETSSAWRDALLAADLLAIDPAAMGGAVLRGPPGPAREAWLARFRSGLDDTTAVRRLPHHCTEDRLLGGLDLTATLATGRRVMERGLLSQCDGGVVLIAMAERWAGGALAPINTALDRHEIAIERDGNQARIPARFGVVAFDESTLDEPPPAAALLDRLAFHIDTSQWLMDGIDAASTGEMPMVAARAQLAAVAPVDRNIVQSLCEVAMQLGIGSLRAPVLALAVARAHAVRNGRTAVTSEDAELAARLVLAPRATRYPELLPEPSTEDVNPPDDRTKDDTLNEDTGSSSEVKLDDVVLAAALAALPPDLLKRLAGKSNSSRANSDGRSGAVRLSQARGRITGVRRPSRGSNARINILATLREAIPWQRVRNDGTARIQVRREDFRVNRYKHRTGTTIIFAVDASGSAALHRLGEAKGAVELLLAECYARRDRVALLAFRGDNAEIRLPPSRSLVLAKRSLAGLPGGGGTPLAAGIDAASSLAADVRRKQDSPLIVFLTDGRANVTRAGQGGRSAAEAEAIAASKALRANGFAAILIDTSAQPHPAARRIAEAMGAHYLPLPAAGAEAISSAVQRERRAAP